MTHLRPPPADHLHLWALADGTQLHAPYGRLAVEESSGHLCCHLCGRWFESLGAHLRAHGTTAEDYRLAMGLCKGVPLTGSHLSSRISARQKKAFDTRPEVREWFAIGQEMARDGTLGRLAQQPDRGGNTSPAAARRDQALATGRETRAAVRRAARQRLVQGAGVGDLETYLRTRYAAGASLEQLGRDTGLGRAALREAMRAAGITTRPRGVNTPAGKSARAGAADREAARRIGTSDLPGWLRARRGEGWTLRRIGDLVGHSSHWVRWRLDHSDDSASASA